MKLSELLEISYVSKTFKPEIVLTSPAGYIYSEEQYLNDKETFLNREILGITLRGRTIKVILQYFKKEKK